MNIFIKIRSQSYALETVLLSKTTSFTNLEGVSIIYFPNSWYYDLKAILSML